MSEYFETFDETGEPLGIVLRDEAHRKGYWHRAANIFVFVPDGGLLIQRRQFSKDIWPGAWDVSAAEHLRPGESFEEGALRGLSEELGIVDAVLEPYGGITKFRLEVVDSGIKDYEFQQSFRTIYDGSVSPDASEVMDIRVVGLPALKAWFLRRPEDFTPWFRQRAADLDLFLSVM
jgi:isopentenyldiphosphate isomerase